MKKLSVVHSHILYIFNSSRIVKKDNEYWTERLGKEYNIREKQKGTPYAKWLKYLKGRRLYCEYVKDVKTLMIECCKKGGYFGQFISQVVFTPCTMHQVEEVVTYLDSHLPFKHYSGGYWKRIFDEFEAEDSKKKKKKLLANRLYHMNAPKVTHHKYLGSEKLKKRLIDTIIDKIFFIK